MVGIYNDLFGHNPHKQRDISLGGYVMEHDLKVSRLMQIMITLNLTVEKKAP